jgi:hypothetical protein
MIPNPKYGKALSHSEVNIGHCRNPNSCFEIAHGRTISNSFEFHACFGTNLVFKRSVIIRSFQPLS